MEWIKNFLNKTDRNHWAEHFHSLSLRQNLQMQHKIEGKLLELKFKSRGTSLGWTRLNPKTSLYKNEAPILTTFAHVEVEGQAQILENPKHANH